MSDDNRHHDDRRSATYLRRSRGTKSIPTSGFGPGRVGTRAAGEVLGAANFLVGEDYRLRIPIGGWMTWDDRLLEGRGVQPDVEVVPTPSEIGAGKDIALRESVGLIAN